MKRGFLNKGKTNSSNDAPKVNHPSPTAVATSTPFTQKKIIRIPTGPIKVFFEASSTDHPLANWPRDSPNMLRTSLPVPSTDRPFDHQSICFFPCGVKEKILAIPNFPGMGTFAIKDLKAGDLILAERPILVLPTALPQQKGAPHPDQFVQHAVDTFMSPTTREWLMNLHNCKGSDRSKISGILDTNGVGLGAMPGHDANYAGIFFNISRINHSCSCNAHFFWDMTTFSARLRALVPIPSGTEITISYITPFLRRSKRQEELRSMYDFTCSCPSCSLSDSDSMENDAIRAKLAFVRDKNNPSDEQWLKAWVKDPDRSDDSVIDQYKQAWGHMEAEGCHDRDLWPALVQTLCKASCALGNMEDAKKWAKHGMTMSLAFTNEEGGWREVYEAPEKTAWWGLKKALSKK